MPSPKVPMFVRIAAALLLACAVFGHWWQHQQAGPRGAALLAIIARHCPAAVAPTHPATVADTAHALDRWT